MTMKRILFCLFFLPTVSNAAFVVGDGDLDLVCKDKNISAEPHNIFDLTFLYDDSTGKTGFELISDENLASGNGELVYQVKVIQFPFYGAEILPVTQQINGCEFAPLSMKLNEDNGDFELYFECVADGDAGYGNLVMSSETGVVEGRINFPEGQSQLLFPIVEDTEIEVSCEYKNL